jgi:hypothetical protein
MEELADIGSHIESFSILKRESTKIYPVAFFIIVPS